MRIAVLDDNDAELNAAAELLREILGETAELVTYASGKAMTEALEAGESFDIAFLDILMEGVNGMDAAHAIRKSDPDCRIVFLTSSEMYAVESYDVRATHYLLKPVTRPRVETALRLCVEALRSDARYIEVTAARQIRRVLLRDILYAEVRGNAVCLHVPREALNVYTSYRRFAPELLKDNRFLQCFHGCIVNMDHIGRIEGNAFVLDNGESVPIRVRSASGIKKTYMNYLFTRLRKEDSV